MEKFHRFERILSGLAKVPRTNLITFILIGTRQRLYALFFEIVN